jgi:hypothetical protein
LLTRAEKRARDAQARQRSMEIPPQDLFEIYDRLEAQAQQKRPPVTLDDIWVALSDSAYLLSLACRVLPDQGSRAFKLNNVPGVTDGTVMTASRAAYERGLPDDKPLRFASYGDPAFDAILGLLEVGGLPPGICRIAVPVSGDDGAELVGYLAMCRDEGGTVTPRALLDMSGLDGLDLDAETPVPPAAIEDLRERLHALARTEFGLLGAATRIEQANEAAGKAQNRLTRLVAKHFILSMQAARRGEANFARQFDILDELAEERPELRLPRMPVDQLCSLSGAGVPFVIRLPAAGNDVPYDTPRPLLKAAVDLAAREAAALHRRRAEVTTEWFLGACSRVSTD